MLLRISILLLLFIGCKSEKSTYEPAVQKTRAQQVYDIIENNGLDPDRAFNYEFPYGDIDKYVWPSRVRGLRNNNWGNIEKGANWVGLGDDTDVRFANFEHPIFGIRALLVITYNYKRRYGIVTIDDWANRWAPPFENNTSKYASFLKNRLKKDTIDFEDYTFMRDFTKGVCMMENGSDRINEAWDNTFFRVAWVIRERTK